MFIMLLVIQSQNPTAHHLSNTKGVKWTQVTNSNKIWQKLSNFQLFLTKGYNLK